MNDTAIATEAQRDLGEIHRLRLELAQANHDRRAAELECRRTLLACGYLRQACGVLWGAFEDDEDLNLAEADRLARRADELLGGVIPLTVAR